jgi:hypothetical protein
MEKPKGKNPNQGSAQRAKESANDCRNIRGIK